MNAIDGGSDDVSSVTDGGNGGSDGAIGVVMDTTTHIVSVCRIPIGGTYVNVSLQEFSKWDRKKCSSKYSTKKI